MTPLRGIGGRAASPYRIGDPKCYQTNPGVTKPPHQGRKIGAIADAHASPAWIEWLTRLTSEVDLVVSTGDLCDKGRHNLEVIRKAQELTSAEKLVPLWGNHELLFATVMLGKINCFKGWMANGGVSFVKEVGIRTDGRSPEDVFSDVLANETLKGIFRWMADNLCLYYLDEFGTLYLHAGIPLREDGTVLLDYAGRSGMAALSLAEDALRDTLLRGYVNNKLFHFLQGTNEALLWNRRWIEIARRVGAKKVLDQLGVERLVFGHTDQKDGTLVIDNRIFGIDRRMVCGEGGMVVVGEDMVMVESVLGGRRDVELKRPRLLNFQEPLKLEYEKGKPIEIVIAPGTQQPLRLQIVHYCDVETRLRFGLRLNSKAGYFIINADNPYELKGLWDEKPVLIPDCDRFTVSPEANTRQLKIERREQTITLTSLGAEGIELS